jgi:hypothetical protein
MRHRQLISVICVWLLVFLAVPICAWATEKQWSGGGDAAAWEDSANWSPTGVPSSSDSIIIDATGAAVATGETFTAKTLTVGGRTESSFTTKDFVFGTVSPSSGTDAALYIKRGGLATLTGSGDITLKGSFKNSEESLFKEPSFMFVAE